MMKAMPWLETLSLDPGGSTRYSTSVQPDFSSESVLDVSIAISKTESWSAEATGNKVRVRVNPVVSTSRATRARCASG